VLSPGNSDIIVVVVVVVVVIIIIIIIIIILNLFSPISYYVAVFWKVQISTPALYKCCVQCPFM